MSPAENSLVSVVIPVYNGSVFLRAALDSVFGQTYPVVQTIAVDDGSTDSSPEILAAYGSRLQVVRQLNAGVAAARNAGIRAARGEFVAFLDQDDWWLPDKIAKQVAVFRAEKEVGLVHTAIWCCDAAGTQHECPPAYRPLTQGQQMVGRCYDLLLLGNVICNSSVMVRRAALDQVGPCDQRIRGNTIQDYDLWLRLARDYTFGHVPERLTVFRLHAAQGHNNWLAMLEQELSMLLRLQPEPFWQEDQRKRGRMAYLHDALATAQYDAGNVTEARRHFAKALAYKRSLRQAFRFTASCLPYALVQCVRNARQPS